MARNKIDYGIDLGTTNSAICRMEKGKPTIKKTDTLKDTMPSCVSINKKGAIKVGDTAYNNMKQDVRRQTKTWVKGESNSYIEFKRTMATSTRYYSGNANKDFSSEELSAEVLKALKSFVTDENINSIVVTVPAKFNVNQKTATIEAAQLAGFKKCELLQEPIAAAMAYGLTADEKNGIWMVFDFGGGTFDAALLKVEDGIMQVYDTEGDNYLGGKNLDYVIVDNIVVPQLRKDYALDNYLSNPDKKEILRDAMKTYVEDARIQLSFKDEEDMISNIGELGADEEGEEIELDMTLTQEEAFDAMRPLYQRAVDICKGLMQRNNLAGSQINKLILVGGPTYCPLIRQMLKEQVTPNVDTSIDPMTAVATGAALYASTIDAEVSDEDIKPEAVKLNIEYQSTTVETTEYVPVSLADSSDRPKVLVEFVRDDKAWSSGKIEIDGKGDVIELNLHERANSFCIVCYDDKGNSIPCFPDEITIIQGSSVGAAPLPYNIGIGVWNTAKNRSVFRMATGLEKNRPLPATGVLNDLKTSSQLRPGMAEDTLTIPLYQVDYAPEAEGRSTSLYQHVGDVVFSGDDVNTHIPKDSLVNVTLRADTSEQMKVEVYFPAMDITLEKDLNTGKKDSIEDAANEVNRGLMEAEISIKRLAEDGIDVQNLRKELDSLKTENQNSSEKRAVLEHLRDLLRKIEGIDLNTEWDRTEKKLRKKFADLEHAQSELGNEQTAQIVNQLRAQVDNVIRQKDVALGLETIDQISGLFFQLTMVYQCIGIIQGCSNRFGSIRWKDSSRAHQLVQKGMEIINDNPTREKLQPIARDLISLMPEDSGIDTGGILEEH